MSKQQLIIGGARSGKSSFAESLLLNDNVLYVASYQTVPNDEEMQLRIKKHQAQRNQLWETKVVDYQLDVTSEYILFDCLSIFVSNVLFHFSKDIEYVDDRLLENIESHLRQEIDKLLLNKNVIIVTNEVGCGLVPEHHIERVYRDILGRINGYVARKVNKVYLVVAHQPLLIKGDNNEN